MSVLAGGPREPSWMGDMRRVCERDDDRYFITPAMAKLLEEMRQGPPAPLWREDDADAGLRWLSSKVHDFIREYDSLSPTALVCTFDGPVEVVQYGLTLYWTCPVCGFEHEQDVTAEFEPDPDAGRDERGMPEDFLRDEP